ncbi:transcription factor IIIB 60 kDa subunit-like protein isoform X1 [Tanacetum coccineum]
MDVHAFKEVAEPVVKAEEEQVIALLVDVVEGQMDALMMDMEEDLAVLFSDDDFGDDASDGLGEEESWEVSCYINNKEESDFKKIIWEHLNKEYMQEQAAKEAAAAAARKLYTGTPEEIEAKVLAAATAAAVASKRQKEKAKRALEAKNAKPAQTAAEAAGQHFTKKRLSSKINYDALNSIFDDEPSEKKSRIDDGDTKGEESGNVKNETKDAVDMEEEEDLEYDDDDETQGDEWRYNNEYEMDGYYEEEY